MRPLRHLPSRLSGTGRTPDRGVASITERVLSRTVKFPLADWIDDHPGCRYNLAHSGMRGSIDPPTPTARELRSADPDALRRRLADLLDTDPSCVFLTHGATEANSAVLQFLAHGRRAAGYCRVQRPEYPPLLDTARWTGFRLTERAGPVALALISQPRNPEGDLWTPDRLAGWAAGADGVLVDETFREFAGTPSVANLAGTAVWRTGSFTKFYAADSIHVGFAVAPPERAPEFAHHHGLLFNELPDYSVAAAGVALRDRERFRREVLGVLAPNREVWRARFPAAKVPAGPVAFDRGIPPDPEAFVGRLLASSVLVCPGRFFEDPGGVRICLTRRSFPQDLDAYLRVRDEALSLTPKGPTRTTRTRPARPHPDSSVPRRGARG